MFLKPSSGLNNHKRKLTVATDWIESSIILLEDQVSKSDVEDIFIEENVYRDKDEAKSFIDDCWEELLRRQKFFGDNALLNFSGRHVRCLKDWKSIPAYSFCLAISLAAYYHDEEYIKRNYSDIGICFELMTKEALAIQYPYWLLFHTGWSTKTSKRFEELIQEIENALNLKRMENYKDYLTGSENDAKLDLILYRMYSESPYCIPIVMLQCASGNNWKNKLSEPDIGRWDKIMNFNSTLLKAIAIPFSLINKELIYHHPSYKGTIFERYRILSAYAINKGWESSDLLNRLNALTEDISNKIEKY